MYYYSGSGSPVLFTPHRTFSAEKNETWRLLSSAQGVVVYPPPKKEAEVMRKCCEDVEESNEKLFPSQFLSQVGDRWALKQTVFRIRALLRIPFSPAGSTASFLCFPSVAFSVCCWRCLSRSWGMSVPSFLSFPFLWHYTWHKDTFLSCSFACLKLFCSFI